MRTEGLFTTRVSVSGTRYSENRVISDFYSDVISRLTAIPGVSSAAAVSFLPMKGLGIGTSYFRMDRPEPPSGQQPSTDVKPVTPGFFKTMGIPQISGRDFAASDTWESTPVAIVSEALARQQYPGEDPIGKRISVFIGGSPRPNGAEIVGVVADIRTRNLTDAIRHAVYMPHTQLPIGLMTFVVRTSLEPLSLTSSVTAAVRAVDPNLPLAEVASMDDVVDATLARPRTVSTLLAVFAFLALVLAGVGVYGVMAYSVSQRTQEIGVRMALGATTGSVFKMMIGDSMKLVAIGLVVGVIAAAWLSQFLASMLFQIGRFDVVTFAITSIVLALVATLASYVPARRGMKVTPVEALRTE